MSEYSRLIELEEVFDSLVASEKSPSPTVLDRWTCDYPQFERELVDFLASWTLIRSAVLFDSHRDTDTEEEAKIDDALVLRGMSIVQNLLYEMSRRPEVPRSLESLLGAAKAAGMNMRDVARAIHLGDAVLRKLDRRLIRFGSIPTDALSAVAEALHCPVDALSQYLQQPPTFAASAHYRADCAPQIAEPEDFIVAVKNDPTMSSEDLRRWIQATKDQTAVD